MQEQSSLPQVPTKYEQSITLVFVMKDIGGDVKCINPSAFFLEAVGKFVDELQYLNASWSLDPAVFPSLLVPLDREKTSLTHD